MDSSTGARAFRTIVRLPAPLTGARLRSMSTLPSAEEARAAAQRDATIRAEGEAAGRASVAPAIAALEKAARALREATQQLEDRAKPQIVALVKAAAGEVIRCEVDEGRHDWRAIAHDCLSVARGIERGAVIHLHPLDCAEAERKNNETNNNSAAESAGVVLEFKPDPTLARGDCRVETPYGAVVREIGAATADVFAAIDGKR
jgi:flagellar biosynthesis/type III secretory pathway protein FliH